MILKLPGLALCASLMLSGCSLAPNYTRPEAPVPQAWPQGDSYPPVSPFSAPQLEPDAFFQNSNLNAVVKAALDQNRSLRATLAQVEAARASYRMQRAGQLPQVNGSAAAGKDQNKASYTADLGLASFELDLFGKNRNLSASAYEQYLSSDFAAKASAISLMGETATAWITLAADNAMLNLARDTVQSAQRSADIAKKRWESGVSSKLDVYQADTVYQQAMADVASYTALVAQDKNALDLLAGQSLSPNLLPAGFSGSNEWLAEPGAGLDSGILLRRPDIEAAEHTLKSANANIGAARAEFFPSISLTSAVGLASSALNGLFSGAGASTWAYTGTAGLPIFSGGKRLANLDYADAMYNKALAEYEQNIQSAFRETSDALARRGTIGSQIEAQKALVEAARQSYELSEKRYNAGIDAYLNVLQSQRTYYSAQQGLISAMQTELAERVTLWKVLGGGGVDNIKYTSSL